MDRPLSLELFAGGGGMALGLHKAGFRQRALVEWWRPAVAILRENATNELAPWKTDQVMSGDVRDYEEALDDGEAIDLVAGGPPCQPFSLAGAHAGFSDERNMFPAALSYVRRFRPRYVVFENVPGLLRPSFAPYVDYVKEQLRRPDIEPKEDELWFEHQRRLDRTSLHEQYRVYQDEIDAADLGVPQNRKRVFIVAIRADDPLADIYASVRRTHSRDVLLHEQWVTGDYWARHGLDKPQEEPLRLRGHIRRVRLTGAPQKKAAWQTLRDVLDGIPTATTVERANWPNHIAIPGARTYKKHTGSPVDLPSKTIKAGVHGVSGGEAMIRWLDGSVRYLTVREAAMVQGFPRNYVMPGPRSRVMGVIGNAVAVEVARAIGDSLLAPSTAEENEEPKLW